MLEPHSQSQDIERLSFKAWLEQNSEHTLSATEQQALQQYLLWMASCEQSQWLSDASVEPLVQQVYQRLGINNAAPSPLAASKPELPQTWWERLGFSQWVSQPMWLASGAMLLFAGLGTSLILHYQPSLESELAQVELTRSASVGTKTMQSELNTAPLQILEVNNVEAMSTALIRDLTATHFTVSVLQELGQQGTIIVIRSPDAPITQTTRQVLKHYQLDAWLSEPNTMIRLHLKASSP